AIDTLLDGSGFGTETGDGATASVTDTPITADGQVKVDAVTNDTINSSIGNKTTASSTGFQGRSGLALGVVLSMNKVSSAANATLAFVTPGLPSTAVSGSGVVVSADDHAKITATTTLVSEVDTTSLSNPQPVKATAVAGTVTFN